MSEQFLIPALAILALGLIIAGALVAHRLERQRREAIQAVTNRLGLSFSPGTNRELARQYEDLRGLHEGENRYAFDIIAGPHLGHQITAFDFHFETSTTNSKGHRRTSHHYLHVILLHLERDFPNLIAVPEDLFSKIAQAFGYDDINFESHEFSRRFCVRSSDKKYAYDFCNALMIEFLLAHPQLRLETRGNVLAFIFPDKMTPSLIEPELALIGQVRQLMPAYLFANA